MNAMVSISFSNLSPRASKLCVMSYQVICDVIRTPGEKNCNNISHKPTRRPIERIMAAGRHAASGKLDVVKTFAISKWKDLLLGSLYNAAIARRETLLFWVR